MLKLALLFSAVLCVLATHSMRYIITLDASATSSEALQRLSEEVGRSFDAEVLEVYGEHTHTWSGIHPPRPLSRATRDHNKRLFFSQTTVSIKVFW